MTEVVYIFNSNDLFYVSFHYGKRTFDELAEEGPKVYVAGNHVHYGVEKVKSFGI